jgi:amino acid permease
MKKEGIIAVTTLLSTMVGAGIFGIPYVVSRAGFITGVILILLIGAMLTTLYVFLGEVVLRTKGNHQLTGYARKYLGEWGSRIMTFSMVIGISGALFAYLIGVGSSLSAVFGGDSLYYSIGFFIVMAVLLHFGIKTFGNSESLINFFVFLAVGLLCIFSFYKINPLNLSGFNPREFFYPYGVILFAFLGASAVPLMKEELKGERRRLLKKYIIVGGAIATFVYLMFTLVVVGVTGQDTTQIATVGLGGVVGEHALIIGNLFAALTMATSFLALGLALKEVFNYDYKINKNLSWGIMLVIPLAFFVFLRGITTFSNILNINGIITGGIECVLFVFMFFKAKKMGERKPEYSVNCPVWIGGLFILLILAGTISNLL